jgi:DNA-binding phage protein
MSQHVGTSITKTTTTPYDVAEHLRASEGMAVYLDAWFDEAPDDAGGIARARRVKLHAAAA